MRGRLPRGRERRTGQGAQRAGLGLLVGPTSRRPSGGRHFALNVLYTVGAACQFVTASKHADVHPSYPLPLTRSLSYDLRRSLDSIIETLDAPAS